MNDWSLRKHSVYHPFWVEALKGGGAWERAGRGWLLPTRKEGPNWRRWGFCATVSECPLLKGSHLLSPNAGKLYTTWNNTFLNSLSWLINHNAGSKNPGASCVKETGDACPASGAGLAPGPCVGACWLQVRVGGTELGHDVILVIVNKIRELDHIGYFQTSFLITLSLTEILLGNAGQIEKKIRSKWILLMWLMREMGNVGGRGNDVGETELFPLGLTSPLLWPLRPRVRWFLRVPVDGKF